MISVYPDKSALYSASAQKIVQLLLSMPSDRPASLVLAGGFTPSGVYDLLPAALLDAGLSWKNIHLFWGDERCVSPDHRHSNYRMVREHLLDKADIPIRNIHRIHGELNPEEACRDFETDLKHFFGSPSGSDSRLNGETGPDVPGPDITLLGLGSDGHTASLFPEHWHDIVNAPENSLSWCLAIPPSGDPAVARITLTPAFLNISAHVIFVAAGASKAAAVRASAGKEISDSTDAAKTNDSVTATAQYIQGRLSTTWMVDREAAGDTFSRFRKEA